MKVDVSNKTLLIQCINKGSGSNTDVVLYGTNIGVCQDGGYSTDKEESFSIDRYNMGYAHNTLSVMCAVNPASYDMLYDKHILVSGSGIAIPLSIADAMENGITLTKKCYNFDFPRYVDFWADTKLLAALKRYAMKHPGVNKFNLRTNIAIAVILRQMRTIKGLMSTDVKLRDYVKSGIDIMASKLNSVEGSVAALFNTAVTNVNDYGKGVPIAEHLDMWYIMTSKYPIRESDLIDEFTYNGLYFITDECRNRVGELLDQRNRDTISSCSKNQ